jgi:hypothetical protein
MAQRIDLAGKRDRIHDRRQTADGVGIDTAKADFRRSACRGRCCRPPDHHDDLGASLGRGDEVLGHGADGLRVEAELLVPPRAPRRTP